MLNITGVESSESYLRLVEFEFKNGAFSEARIGRTLMPISYGGVAWRARCSTVAAAVSALGARMHIMVSHAFGS